MKLLTRTDTNFYILIKRYLLSLLIICFLNCLSCFLITSQSAISEVRVGEINRVQYDENTHQITQNQCGPIDQRVVCSSWHTFGESPLVIPSDAYLRSREDLLKKLWVTDSEVTQNAIEYFDFLRSLSKDGLDPNEYGLEELVSLAESVVEDGGTKLSDLCNRSLIKLISDLHWGRRRYRVRDFPQLYQYIKGEPDDNSRVIEYHLDQAVRSHRLVDFLRQQLPTYSQYLQLREQLGFFRKLASLQQMEDLKRGRQDRSGAVPSSGEIEPDALELSLRALVDLGELSVEDSRNISTEADRRITTKSRAQEDLKRDSLASHPLFIRALKSFQARMGLVADGVIGAKTLQELLRPATDRIHTISMNLERWRWLPHALDDSFWDTFLMVNTAGFELVFVRERRLIDRMPVIVGTRYNRTPTFSASVEAVEFNPFWNVPNSIASNELWPKERRAPGSLERQNIRVLSGGRLRQDPGPGNALGLIKFVLPNQFNVYLHDTPTKHLFTLDTRAFSHGCIRVSRPVDLALEVLNSEESTWTRDKINLLISEGKNRKVHLPKEIPIHIVYRTAWVENDGKIHFRPDIYGKDQH